MYQNCCKKCGSLDLHTEVKGSNTGLYCSDCGAWIKWLGKDELRAFENAQTKENERVHVNLVDNTLEKVVDNIYDTAKEIEVATRRGVLNNEELTESVYYLAKTLNVLAETIHKMSK
jgi:uncharacterized protein YlaN (UPF0358 family)